MNILQIKTTVYVHNVANMYLINILIKYYFTFIGITVSYVMEVYIVYFFS